MEMTKDKSTKNLPTKGLPPKHFAILFEGAWLFTPDPNDSTRILATCPFVSDPTHICTFGLWGGQTIKPLPNMKGTMGEPDSYHVYLKKGFGKPAPSFGKLFEAAASKYPFVYLASQSAGRSGKLHGVSFKISDDATAGTMRQVSIPMPTEVRAEGALITAEIGGLGLGEVYRPSKEVKRPFVTFVFVYPYKGARASATIDAQGTRAPIDATIQHPRPHLIFNVRPLPGQMTHGQRKSLTTHPMDDAGQISHAVATFEVLRQLVSKTTYENAKRSSKRSLCNIALFHGRGKPEFLLMDSGLTGQELGTKPSGAVHPKDTDLASCAGGGMAVG